MFSSIGLPGALAYVVAGAEVLGGIGLLVPRFTRLAAMGLVLVMVGAVSMHATKIPGGLANGVPALVYASHLNDPADGGERPQKSLIISVAVAELSRELSNSLEQFRSERTGFLE